MAKNGGDNQKQTQPIIVHNRTRMLLFVRILLKCIKISGNSQLHQQVKSIISTCVATNKLQDARFRRPLCFVLDMYLRKVVPVSVWERAERYQTAFYERQQENQRIRKPWSDLGIDQNRIIAQSAETGGVAYEGLDALSNTRQLVYYSPEAERNWTVVVVTPYEVVLTLAWRTWGPMIGVLAAATVGYMLVLFFMATNISQTMNKLLQASERITTGDYSSNLEIEGEDEIGKLGHAFVQMQKSLRNRMSELSLLLNVSENVSASLNVDACDFAGGFAGDWGVWGADGGD